MTGSALNGIIVIDKPRNISSAGVVKFVKKTLNADKVGHAGTLDPFAEGVLICCVNQATRIAGFLLGGKKKYVATIKLGEETDTQDFTGSVVSTCKPADFSLQTIQNVFSEFIGAGEQLPPVYSALKHKGVPLYKLARRGKPVQKPPRQVRIYSIIILEIAPPFIHFEVTCSAGTYIRTLCADIGKSLGCGGHLTALKRLECSGFKLNQAISLSELEKLKGSAELTERLVGMADALPDMPQFYADRQLVDKIRQGRIIKPGDLTDSNVSGKKYIPDSAIKIVDRNGDLIAILNYREAEHRLKYRCVFPPQSSRQ